MSTLKVTNINAADGTSALSIADSTGKVTTVDSELNVKAVNGSTTHTFTVKGIGESIGDSQSSTAPDTTDSDSGQLAIYNGATKLWGINEDGWVQTPNAPAFCAGLSANPTASGGGTIIFDDDSSAPFFNSGHYDTSNGKFTCPIDGKYLYSASVLFGSVGTADDGIYLMSNLNGSAKFYFARLDGTSADGYYGYSGYVWVQGVSIFNASAGDYITSTWATSGSIFPHGSLIWTRALCYFLG